MITYGRYASYWNAFLLIGLCFLGYLKILCIHRFCVKSVTMVSMVYCRIVYYRPQRSCEGYVFTGVCLSTGGCLVPGGCLILGGVRSHGGAWSPGGAWSRGGGGLISQHALRQIPLGETATAADGTHPTLTRNQFLIHFRTLTNAFMPEWNWSV